MIWFYQSTEGIKMITQEQYDQADADFDRHTAKVNKDPRRFFIVLGIFMVVALIGAFAGVAGLWVYGMTGMIVWGVISLAPDFYHLHKAGQALNVLEQFNREQYQRLLDSYRLL